MPKIRLRSTKKAQWSSATLAQAEELMKQGLSMRNAAKSMNIPFSSLQKRLKKQSFSDPRLGRQPVFTAELEQTLAERIKLLSNIFYGCTAIQIRKIAYKYANDLGLKHNFDPISKMAGRDWLEGFLRRNNISVRKPEPTSINRITAFNKTEVHLFYTLLEELMTKHNFAPKNIYNCDETGISTVQDPGKILAPKGQKRVGSITSWERGKNITVLCAMSAAGGFVPPMFIFPRKRMTPQLEKDGPPGSLYKCSDNGWINEDLFYQWLKHFTSHAKPTVEEPVLLILDNHASHTSLAVYEHCKENNIHMLSLPPHTSHRMQPLDIVFYGPLKAAYKRECDLFLKNRLAEKISPYDVASLFNKAYSGVASISKGESGFRAAGIFPLNPNVFSQEDFIAAEVLNESLVVVHDNVVSVPTTDCQIPTTSASVTTAKDQTPSISVSIQTMAAQVPRSSMASTTDNQMPSTSTQSNQSSQIIDTLLPIPKGKQSVTTRKGQAKKHSQILTTTPLKESLIDKENKKIAKKNKEEIKRNTNIKKSARTGKGPSVVASKKRLSRQKSVNKAKRRILQEPSSSTESDISLTNVCDDNEDDDTEDAGNICMICSEFGRNNEMWYRCTSCGLWAHEDCTGWDSPEGYVCDNC